MPRTPPEPIARLARPFFSRVLELVAEHGGTPSDYFLVVGKYDPAETALLPRAQAAGVVASAKPDARRRKYERFLAVPCDRGDLLVMVCAGNHVEAHWVRVHALPDASEAGTEDDITAHTERWASASYDALVDAGEDPSKYIVYVSWPPPAGQPVAPKVFLRSEAPDELRALQGTKKYEQLLPHLADTRDDVLLAIDVAGSEDLLVVWRGDRSRP